MPDTQNNPKYSTCRICIEECPYCGTTDNRHPRWCHAEIWPRPDQTQQIKTQYRR